MIKDKANYISVKDLAELVDISDKTIRREINNHNLKAIKVSKIFRIKKSDALQWLKDKEYLLEDGDEKDLEK